MGHAVRLLERAPAPPPPATATPAARTWVLLGRRHGDNQQMLALVAATGLPFTPVPVTFNPLSALPNLILGTTRASTRWPAGMHAGPPWPDVVITSGRRAVPLARWIRERSGGRTRLVHVGRPWAPLSWYDLVITTPQYRLPPRHNVIHNLMPLGTAARARGGEDSEPLALSALPRPWTAVFMGGPVRPLVLDDQAVDRIAVLARAAVAAHGGSVAVCAGPRTPAAVLETLRRDLPGNAMIVPWGRDPAPGQYLRRHAQRFIVTDDSVAMLAELLATGKPVQVAALTRRPDLRLRWAAWLDGIARRHGFVARLQQTLIGAGVLASVRDPGLCVSALRDAGLLADGTGAAWRAEQELRAAAARVRGLADGAAQAVAGSVTRTRNPPRSGAVSNVITPP